MEKKYYNRTPALATLSLLMVFFFTACDVNALNVTMTSPPNNSVITTPHFTLNYTVDMEANCTAYVWNASTGELYTSGNVTGTGDLHLDLNYPPDAIGNYTWNVYCINVSDPGENGWGNQTTNWTFRWESGGGPGGPHYILVNKTLLSSPNPSMGEIVQYMINITNNGSDDVIDLWVRDVFDSGLVFNGNVSCAPYNFSNAINDSYVNINVTQCIGGNITPNQSAIVFMNLTAAAFSQSRNYVEATGRTEFSPQDNVQSGNVWVQIGGGGPPGGGNNWSNGFRTFDSSIDSPYLVKNESKLIPSSLRGRRGTARASTM